MSVHGDCRRYDVNLANFEAKQCDDLLSQSQYCLTRARKIDNDERNKRLNQEEEREFYRVKRIEEQAKELQKLDEQKKEMLLKRQEYKEKTKNALVFDTIIEKPKRKIKRRVNYGSDSGGSIASVPGGNRSSRPSKSIKLRKRLFYDLILLQ